MGDGFRGIDAAGLARLAGELDNRGAELSRRRLRVAGILADSSPSDADAISTALDRVVSWAGEESDNLRWRSSAIAELHHSPFGSGVPYLYIAEAHRRAVIGAFLPSRFNLEMSSTAWTVARYRIIGHDLADRHSTGEDITGELAAISGQAHFEIVAAAFFNSLGAEATAALPQMLRHTSGSATGATSDAAGRLQHYARAFSAATRSGDLEFTPAELLADGIGGALSADRFSGAHLLTEPGIAPPWLEYAAAEIVFSDAYVPWVASVDAVVAVLRGLVGNPTTASTILALPGSIETLLRRSSLLRDEAAAVVGEALVTAVTQAPSKAAAAHIAKETVIAIGRDSVQPHRILLPDVALIGGLYLDEIAGSLVSWDHDPTVEPHFVVERDVARQFILEMVRDTNAYAVTLSGMEAWISEVTAAGDANSLADYVRRVSNRVDDIGMFLATILGADRISGVERAEEMSRRQAMLLDAVSGAVGIAAGLAGPAAGVVQQSADLLRDRASDLLGTDPIPTTMADNDAFREILLDELRATLHETVAHLEFPGPQADLDPRALAEQQGMALMQILAAIYSTMSQFEPESFDQR